MSDFLYNHPKFKDRRRELRRNSTDAEIIIWNCVRNNKLGIKFRRQFSIGGYIADFCCPEKRLIIELDGSQHYYEDGLEYDKIRDTYLKSLDYTVLRFSNNDVIKSLDGVIMKIQEYLDTSP